MFHRRLRGLPSLSAPKFIALPLASAIMGIALPAFSAPVPPTPKPKPAAVKPPVAKPTAVKNPATSEYLLGPDDVLDVTVSNHPDLNTTVTVRPDGKITLPRAGEVVAKGRSARDLAQDIQNRLAQSLNNAHVQILVKQARPRQVRIIGAVKTAGTYPLQTGGHLLDLVAQAGGLSTKPTRISGRVIRAGNAIAFDMGQASTEPGGASNVALRPDDLIVLDAKDYAKQITVMGSVKTPGAYDLEEGLTVMGLLAQAGGPLENAALRKAQVLRGGQPVLTDLSAIVQGTATPDSPLAHFSFQPGDVLNVPENQARFGVMGQVVKPSYYSLPENESDATVLKALSQAGGALADGDLAGATITRTQNGQSQTIPINAELMLAGKAPDNMSLRNDDVLLIPKRKEEQVSVIGQVAKPGTYPLEGDKTLLSLLAEAGNPAAGAGLSRAYVLRDGVQVPINLYAAVVNRQVSSQIADFTLKDNDVLVIPDVREQVQVIGQVAKPGAYSLDDDLTVMSLLSKAGSAGDSAALGKAYVLRNGQRIQFDLRSTVMGNIDPAALSFRFAPGDILVVPENQVRLAVLGQVAKPGYYPFPENPADASILKVLTEAGGPVGTGAGGANLSQAGIIRTVNGQAQIIPVNIDQLLRKGAASQNVQLQPDDILYIPSKKQGLKLTDVLGPLAILGHF